MPSAPEIVNTMMSQDAFSQWLGIQVLEAKPGHVILEMTVREEMTNGFSVAHGGITYALADSALAFASNGHGEHALSVETSISHLKPVRPGDVLRATASPRQKGKTLARYDVEVSVDGNPVALFKGTVFHTSKHW